MFKFGHKRKQARGDIIGIDLSGNILRIIHFRDYQTKKEIIDVFSRDIEGLEEKEVAGIINDYFQNIQATKAKIIGVIPAQSVITKNVEIPSIVPQEIKKIISLQATRHTPYSREEIIVDYIEIGTYRINYTKILLIIVAKNVVKKFFSLLKERIFRVEKIFFAPEAISRSARQIFKLDKDVDPVGIIHIDSRFTDFIISLKNKVCFVRSIPIGTIQLIYEKEKYQSRFLEEIRNSLEAYRNEDIDVNPQMFILTGAVEELKGLGNFLYSILNLPIREISYLDALQLSDEIKEKNAIMKTTSFLNVVSSVLNMKDLKIDFVPEEIKFKRALEERGKELIKAGIYVLTIFVMVVLIIVSKIWLKSTYLKVLNEKLQEIEKETKVLEADLSRISIIKRYLNERGLLLDVLSELSELLPADIQLTNVKYEGGRELVIAGTALAMSSVFSFVEKLEQSKLFQEVKTKYTTKRKEDSQEVTDFAIEVLIKRE